MLEVLTIVIIMFLLGLLIYGKPNRKHPVKWISIEGIIGAGKTTLIQAITPHLEKHYDGDVLIVPEPVSDWISSGHLENASIEPYVAQTYFFHTRIETFLKLFNTPKGQSAKVIISERSPISDRFIFWETTCSNGLPSELAQKTYPALWSTWMKLLGGMSPDLYIYLTLDVATSQQRMHERNRTCEQSTVTTSYQEQLELAHNEVFLQGEFPSVSISSTRNFRDDPKIAKDIADQIIKIIGV